MNDIGLAFEVTVHIGQILGEVLTVNGEAGGIKDMQGAGFQRLDDFVQLFNSALGSNITVSMMYWK